MDLSNIEFRPFFYKVEECVINISGYGDCSVPAEYVTTIAIEKDYDDFLFPYLALGVSIPNAAFRAMCKPNARTTVNLNISAGFGSTDVGDEELEDNVIWKTWLNQKFYVMNTNMTQDVTAANDEEAEKENGSYKKFSVADMTNTNLLLYNEEYLFKMRKSVNAVLNKCSLIDAVTFILSKCGVKKILVSPPFNNTKYDQIIIPPMSGAEDIDYLCNTFAMHQCGSVIFFDWKRGYIIDKHSKCTAWEPNEYKTVTIGSTPIASGLQEAFRGGCYLNAGEAAINIQAGSYQFSKPSVVLDQSAGTNIVMIDSKTGTVTNTKTNAKTDSSGGSTAVYVTDSGVNLTKLVAQKIREASKVVNIKLESIDLEMLLPNKEFIISIDDPSFKEFMGKYRCSKFSAILSSNGRTMQCSAKATFVGYNE